MNNFEANIFARDIHFRSPVRDSDGDIVKKSPVKRDAGVMENPGIDKKLFLQFKKENPQSEHPLVDFLKTHLQENASFNDLASEYLIVGSMIENKNWFKDDEDNRRLSLLDISTLFEHKKWVNNTSTNISKTKTSVRNYFRRWKDQLDRQLESKKLPGYADFLFYKEEDIKEFLLFTLDVFSERKLYDPTKTNRYLNFKKTENFQPITQKFKRQEFFLNSSSQKNNQVVVFDSSIEAQGEDETEKLIIVEPDYRLIGQSIVPQTDRSIINGTLKQVVSMVRKGMYQVEMIIGNPVESQVTSKMRTVKVGEAMIEAKFKYYLNAFKYIYALDSDGRDYDYYILMKIAQKKGLNSYFIFNRLNPFNIDNLGNESLNAIRAPKQAKLMSAIESGRAGRKPTIDSSSFTYKGKPLLKYTPEERRKLYPQIGIKDAEAKVIEVYLANNGGLPKTIVQIAFDAQIPKGSVGHLTRKALNKLKQAA